MKTFNDLKFVSSDVQPKKVLAKENFDNGFGVSVIKGPYTFGGPEGFYELAVLHRGSLDYTTPVTNDVEGWLTPEKVTELMKQVQELPPK